MSLTSFLGIPRIRARFAEEFTRPEFYLRTELLAPPLSKRYSLVGTAFDYLLRFLIKSINPNAITRPWVARHSLEVLGCLKRSVKTQAGMLKIEETIDTRGNPTGKRCARILAEAEEVYGRFLRTRKIQPDLIMSAIKLAQLDIIWRSGYVDDHIGRVHKEDVADLERLVQIVDPSMFVAKRYCVLNPTFGPASAMVGGADADILMDGTLIEVKTTKDLGLKRHHLNQLIGYLILSRLAPVDGLPRTHQRQIQTLGIYFARQGVLHTFPLGVVVDKKRLPAFIRWFVMEARRQFPNRQEATGTSGPEVETAGFGRYM